MNLGTVFYRSMLRQPDALAVVEQAIYGLRRRLRSTALKV